MMALHADKTQLVSPNYFQGALLPGTHCLTVFALLP